MKPTFAPSPNLRAVSQLLAKAQYMRAYRQKNIEKFRIMERERSKQRRATGDVEDPEIIRQRSRKYHHQNRDKNLARMKVARLRLLHEVVQAYGGRCFCCKESRELFLTIDHVNNDGHKERKTMGGRSGVHLYRSLKIREFPKDGYRLMCFNCNLGRARNGGVCPHKRRKYT